MNKLSPYIDHCLKCSIVVNDRHNGATDFRRNGASEKG